MDMRILACAVLLLVLVPGVGEAQEGQDEGTADWQANVLPQPAGEASVVGVAAGPELMVAVGDRVCDSMTGASALCRGQSWASPDGITWQAADPRTSGLGLGRMHPVLSGPVVGLQGVAYGPAGFLAFGRVGSRDPQGQRTAVWRSDDGLSWERLTDAGTFPRGARVRTILGTDDGYLMGGVIYREKAPRAAVWSSPDGRGWTRGRGTRDDQTFEIGGYIDTMEDPAAGGINAFAPYPDSGDGSALLSAGVVAVGQACMPSFDRDPWAWNGACWGELWRSSDGRTWHKDEGAMPRPHGAISHAAAVAERLVVDAPVCHEQCASALLLADDLVTWRVAFGSPVDGELRALASQDGRFLALMAAQDVSDDSSTTSLVLWASDDGRNWTVDESQPTLPVPMTALHDVDLAVSGDRLVVTASGETRPEGDLVSVVLLGPSRGDGTEP